MSKELLLSLLFVVPCAAMEQDLEAGRQLSPHQQQINERLAHLRALVTATIHAPDTTPRHDEALEAIAGIEQVILEALRGNPEPVAEQAGRAWQNIQNPRAKAGVGIAVAGLLVLANQWLSCTVEK